MSHAIFFKKIFTVIIKIIGICFLIVLVLSVIAFLFEYSIASKPYKGSVSEHFDGERFWNIGEREGLVKRGERQEGEEDFGIRSVFYRDKEEWKQVFLEEVVPKKNSEELVVTHITHASVLIQIGGKNIITDPIYSERASPLSFFGPKRHSSPRVLFENLPKIDMILVTHNHYDHMDIATLRMLYARDAPVIVTTLGNKGYLEERGIKGVIETDWYETFDYFNKQLVITTVPAQHFSARGIRDRNVTLWAGFVLDINKKKIYISGDTGYGPFIEKIQTLFPEGFDYGVLPIGAYTPRWFMKMMHTNPEEALQMMVDLKIKRAVGVHFGTFPLASDAQYDPVRDLQKALQQEKFKGLNFELQGW
jgi:L-ascorbate metabolism protein UlaG (beta-lactamase superfamily)